MATEERVRPCLECETVLPFDTEVCGLCGTRTRTAAADEEEAVKPCLACEALIPESDIFCSNCGDFALRVTEDGFDKIVGPIGAREGGAVTFLSRLDSIVILVTAIALVSAVVVEWLRSRDLVPI